MSATMSTYSRDSLLSGDRLYPGQSLASADGRFHMTFDHDGILTLVGPQNQPYWTSSNSTYANAVDCIMQQNGNLVVYDDTNTALWASNTKSNPGAILVLHSDGNAVINGTDGSTLWSTETLVPITPELPGPQLNQLLSGQGLMSQGSLISANVKFRLDLQADGNLVQYGGNNQVVWASNTSGNMNIWDAIMQPDGNFVVFNMNGLSLWSTDTSGNDGSRLVVEDEGGIVLYNAQNESIWSVGKVTKSTPTFTNTTTNFTNATITTTMGPSQSNSSSQDAEIVGGVLAVVIVGLVLSSIYLWLAKRICRAVEGPASREIERFSANLGSDRRVPLPVNETDGVGEIITTITEEPQEAGNATEKV